MRQGRRAWRARAHGEYRNAETVIYDLQAWSLRRAILDNSLQITDINTVPASCGSDTFVAAFFHLEYQSAKLIHLSLNVAENVIPQLLPLHGNLDLAADALESHPDLGPFRDDTFHLSHSMSEVICGNVWNVSPGL